MENSRKIKGQDKIGRKPPLRVFSEQQETLDVQRDLLPLLSEYTQIWVCAQQLGKQDIANT